MHPIAIRARGSQEREHETQVAYQLGKVLARLWRMLPVPVQRAKNAHEQQPHRMVDEPGCNECYRYGRGVQQLASMFTVKQEAK